MNTSIGVLPAPAPKPAAAASIRVAPHSTAANELGFVEGELKAQMDHKEKRTLALGDFTPEQQEEIKQKMRSLKLTEPQIRNIERDPEFLKIRELLGQKYLVGT